MNLTDRQKWAVLVIAAIVALVLFCLCAWGDEMAVDRDTGECIHIRPDGSAKAGKFGTQVPGRALAVVKVIPPAWIKTNTVYVARGWLGYPHAVWSNRVSGVGENIRTNRVLVKISGARINWKATGCDAASPTAKPLAWGSNDYKISNVPLHPGAVNP